LKYRLHKAGNKFIHFWISQHISEIVKNIPLSVKIKPVNPPTMFIVLPWIIVSRDNSPSDVKEKKK